ncbi:MAG: hypothetical protein NT013_15675 [Planctomycetia bacterium]|nr:hypothetical protein [Planctomycetia bacterium]
MSKYAEVWNLSCPRADFVRRAFVNGTIAFSAQVPGVNCSECGNTWSGHRVLPFPCSSELQQLLRETTELQPVVSLSVFQTVKRQLETYFADLGRDVVIEPGDVFVPGNWSIPSIPRHDILWPILSKPVISARLTQLLDQSSIAMSKLNIARVGHREPTDDIPHLTNGEFDDDYFLEHGTSMRENVGEFFLIHITEPITYQPARFSQSTTCRECGFVFADYDPAAFGRVSSELRRRQVIPKNEAPSVEVFSHFAFDGIMVSPRVYEAIAGLGLANCIAKPIRVSG